MEIFRSLGALVEPPEPGHQALADALGLGPLPTPAAHAETFLFRLYPYASVYLGPEGQMGGDARDRVAGFWRVLGQTPPAEPDHLTVLLAAYAELCERSADEADPGPWTRARRVFLWEHLVSWLPLFLDKLVRDGRGEPFYVRWAELLRDALAEELDAAGLRPDPIFEAPPACLAVDPGLPDPRLDGADALLGGLTAPARCGFILTSDDLRHMAFALGLAPRAGERRFVLKGLFGHDAAGVLSRLRELAAETRLSQTWGPVAEIWHHRRDTSSSLLEALQADAEAGT